MRIEAFTPSFSRLIDAGLYAELVDSIQASGFPPEPRSIAERLGVDDSKVRSMLARLKVSGAVAKADFSLPPLGLSYVTLLLPHGAPALWEETLLAEAETLSGLVRLYGVPRGCEGRLVESYKSLGVKVRAAVMASERVYARPSMAFYVREVASGGRITPRGALRRIDDAPRPAGVAERVMAAVVSERLPGPRDTIDLVILSALAEDLLAFRRRLASALRKLGVRQPLRKLRVHRRHVEPMLKGSRVLAIDRGSAVAAIAVGSVESMRSLRMVVETASSYLYTLYTAFSPSSGDGYLNIAIHFITSGSVAEAFEVKRLFEGVCGCRLDVYLALYSQTRCLKPLPHPRLLRKACGGS